MMPMTPEELAATAAVLGPSQNPAAPELVTSVVESARRLRQVGYPESRAMALARDVPAVVRRLLDVETALATTRAVVARIAHSAGEGDDYALSDLVWELQRAGVGVDREMADVAAVRTAEYEAQARL